MFHYLFSIVARKDNSLMLYMDVIYITNMLHDMFDRYYKIFGIFLPFNRKNLLTLQVLFRNT